MRFHKTKMRFADVITSQKTNRIASTGLSTQRLCSSNNLPGARTYALGHLTNVRSPSITQAPDLTYLRLKVLVEKHGLLVRSPQ